MEKKRKTKYMSNNIKRKNKENKNKIRKKMKKMKTKLYMYTKALINMVGHKVSLNGKTVLKQIHTHTHKG